MSFRRLHFIFSYYALKFQNEWFVFLSIPQDNIEALPESDEETEGPGSNKRGLSDSYLALKEASPSVPQMKRHSAEYLPRVPGCLDSSYYESMPLIGTLSKLCHFSLAYALFKGIFYRMARKPNG